MNASDAWVTDPDVTSTLSAVMNGTTQTGWRLVKDDDSRELYTLDGRLVSITDRAGRATNLTYDINSRLTTVTGPFGHRLTFSYNASGRIQTITLPDGGILTYGYDAADNLVSVSYPDNAVRRYVYNEQLHTANIHRPHALTGIIDETGARFATFDYNTAGWAIASEHAGQAQKVTVTYGIGESSVTDALGNVHGYLFSSNFDLLKPTTVTGVPVPNAGGKSMTYDANGFVSSRTDFNSSLTTYTHDARGLEVSRTQAAGTPLARTIATTWHPSVHLPTQVTEPNRVTRFTYDTTGNLTQRTVSAAGLTRTWRYTYNAKGQVTQMDGPRTDVSDVTQLGYDTNGNLARTTNALGHVTQITAYDANGRPLTLADPNGLVTRLTYDPRGRLLSRDQAGEVTTYSYDAVGQLLRATGPDGSFFDLSYDPAHRLTQARDNLGNRIAYTLDAAGNRIKEDSYDPFNTLTRTLTRGFDALGRVKTAVGAQGQTMTLGYDDNGNLTSATDPVAHTKTLGYDVLNRLVLGTDALAGRTLYAYDGNHNLTQVTDPRGLATSYQYDALGNQTAILSPDTNTRQNTFDDAGNLTGSTDANGNLVSYTYDALNRVTSVNYPNAAPVVFSYDQGTNGVGRLSQMTDATGSTQWTYDVHGRVTRKTQRVGTLNLAVEYRYDVGGRLTSISYPSGKIIDLKYTQGQVTEIAASGTPLLANIRYRPFGSAQSWTWGNGTAYGRVYDNDGRLTRYDLGGHTRQISYDPAGRVQGYTDSPPLPSLVNPGLSETYSYGQTDNRLMGIAGTAPKTYTYDQAGNVVTDSVNRFGYDGRGRLLQVTTPRGIEHYAVNGLGQRVAKGQVPGDLTGPLFFVYDEGGHLLGEYDSTGAAVAETVWFGDTPVAVHKPNSPGRFFIYADHLGTPRAIADGSNGRIVWRWESEPFGSNQPDEDPDRDGTAFSYHLRLPGQYFDLETGLNYNGFRDYDSRSGRYIQGDPIGLAGGLNPYLYASGAPSNSTDPNGLRDWGKILASGRDVVTGASEIVGGVTLAIGGAAADVTVIGIPVGILGGAAGGILILKGNADVFAGMKGLQEAFSPAEIHNATTWQSLLRLVPVFSTSGLGDRMAEAAQADIDRHDWESGDPTAMLNSRGGRSKLIPIPPPLPPSLGYCPVPLGMRANAAQTMAHYLDPVWATINSHALGFELLAPGLSQ